MRNNLLYKFIFFKKIQRDALAAAIANINKFADEVISVFSDEELQSLKISKGDHSYTFKELLVFKSCLGASAIIGSVANNSDSVKAITLSVILGYGKEFSTKNSVKIEGLVNISGDVNTDIPY